MSKENKNEELMVGALKQKSKGDRGDRMASYLPAEGVWVSDTEDV